MSVVIDPELEPRTTPLSDVVRYVVGSTTSLQDVVAAMGRGWQMSVLRAGPAHEWYGVVADAVASMRGERLTTFLMDVGDATSSDTFMDSLPLATLGSTQWEVGGAGMGTRRGARVARGASAAIGDARSKA